MIRLGPIREKLTTFNVAKRCYAIAIAEERDSPPQPASLTDLAHAKPYEAIPGPRPLPIVGNMWRFFGGVDFLKIMDQMYKKHGDVVNMRKLLAFGDVLFLFNVRDIEWLYRNEGPNPFRDGNDSIYIYRHILRRDIFGDTYGVVSGQQDRWGSFRTAVNPIMLRPRTAHQYIPHLNEVADEFLAHVRRLKAKDANSEMPENFLAEVNKWSFESITQIALDTKLGCLQEVPSERALTALQYLNEIFVLMFKLDYLPTGKLHVKYNTRLWKRFLKIEDYFSNMCLGLIKDLHEKIQNDPNYAQKPEHEKSVFERLVNKDDKIAMVMALDMLGGGADTTARVSCAIMYYLAQNRDVQEKLRAELKRLLPTKSSDITKEIIEEAKYLKVCIREALRLAPIAVANFRRTSKPLVFGGYYVPEGTPIFLSNLYLSKVTDQHFVDPQAFIPERWLRDEKTAQVNPFASLPFGYGRRGCIGQRFANAEMYVLIAKMVRNFVLEWRYKEMKFSQEVMYAVSDPVRIKLTELNE